MITYVSLYDTKQMDVFLNKSDYDDKAFEISINMMVVVISSLDEETSGFGYGDNWPHSFGRSSYC